MKVNGLEHLQQRLADLQQRAEALDGTHELPATDLLTDRFMRANTEFGTFADMIKASGFKIENAEDFKAIPDDHWDAFVAAHTSFRSWQEMLNAAARLYVTRKLGLE